MGWLVGLTAVYIHDCMFTGMTVTPDSSPRTAVHRGNSSDDDTSGVDNCKSTDDIISLLDSLRIGPDGPGVKVERDYDLKTKGTTLAHPQVTMDIIPDFPSLHFHKSRGGGGHKAH